MTREQRLSAIQAAMVGRPAPTIASLPTAPRAQPSANATIAALRSALAAEHKARLAAEARLRGVLEEVAALRAAPRPMTLSLPASTQVVEAEVVDEISETQAAIYDIGGDEPEEEDDSNG